MKWNPGWTARGLRCALWVALCFGVTSAAYLSWLNRLILLAGPGPADWHSMVLGYLFQALGLSLASLRLRQDLSAARRERDFHAALLCFIVCAVPALLTHSAPFALVFGWLMNLACGFIAGGYLWGTLLCAGKNERSLAFGGGYALASAAVGLLALPAGGVLLRGTPAVLICLLLTLLLSLWTHYGAFFAQPEDSLPAAGSDAGQIPKPDSLLSVQIGAAPNSPDHSIPAAKSDAAPMTKQESILPAATIAAGMPDQARLPMAGPDSLPGPSGEKLIALACAAVFMISLVKNLGFAFPSSDISAGVRPELSRMLYALGLLLAAWGNDRHRKNGLVAAVAALFLPFVMIALSGEAVPAALCWGLDYLFYGFYTVFRAVLFLDLSARFHRPALAPLGLLLGRVGDAAGSALSLLLAGQRVALVSLTALLFIVSVVLCFLLWQRLHASAPAQDHKSEQEVFEAFCLHNDISSREREVLRLLLDSRTNAEIAGVLFISENTVKYHVRNILQKTGCKNRGELQRSFTLSLYPRLAEKEKPA